MGATNQKRGALHSAMGRPVKGVLSSHPEPLRKLIKQIRENEGGFGAQSILAELVSQYGYAPDSLPSQSRVAAYLQSLGLTRQYEKHNPLPRPVIVAPEAAHDLWQLDGRGNEWVENVGAIALLDIKDVFSHVYVGCFPALMASMKGHPDTDNYQTALRLGFMEFGLPKLVQVDHASVFSDNSSKSPFPTRLHLWLVGLGIELFYSRVRRPTDQAMVERSHEILYNQVFKGATPFRDWEHLFNKCQKRRYTLNCQIGSRSCESQPPLVIQPDAGHSKRFYTLQNEENMIRLERVYRFLDKGKWFRQVAGNNMVFLGGQAYYVKNARPKEQLQITFCADCQHLLFQNDKELLIALYPIKGIGKKQLMGSRAEFFNVPNVQLKIPFNWEEKIDTTFRDFA
ncbi:MAG: hypothetical protein R2792_14055 [Saprospiraceae bacterium]